MEDKLDVPRRKVRKNWYVDLYPDHVDRSHPDVHDESLIQEASNVHSVPHRDVTENVTADNTGSSVNTSSPLVPGTTGSSLHTSSTSTLGSSGSSIDESTLGSSGFSTNASKSENESKQEVFQAGQDNGLLNNLKYTSSVGLTSGGIKAENAAHSERSLLQENDSKETSHAKDEVEMQAASVENKGGLEEDADASFDLLRDAEDLEDEYSDDYVDPAMWGDGQR